MVENLLAMWEIWVPFLGQEDPLEKGKAMHPQYSCLEDSMDSGAWQATIQKFPEMWDTWVQSLGQEDPLEKGKATHSSILACRIHGGVTKSQT